MDTLKIKIFPNPALNKKAARVSCVGREEKKALADMATAMYLNRGVGLAAVQVGIDKQLVVLDVGSGLIKMANPEVIKCEGSEAMEEGCLSVPGVGIKIKRARKVTVRFLDESGQTVQVQADGLFARAIQHEIDHLRGVLIIDHVNPLKKIFLRKKIRCARNLDKNPVI
jgi:peptide deformylase